MSSNTFTVDQYHRMIDNGVVRGEDSVELLEGKVVHQQAKSPLHCCATGGLRDILTRLMPLGYFVSTHAAVTLSNSETEPDISAIRGERQRFAKRHPTSADVALLVEVSDKSMTRNGGAKKRIYAESNISQYWIVNLVDRQIEVYRRPDAAAGKFRDGKIYGLQEDVPVMVDAKRLGTLRLEQLLPWQ